MKYFIYIIFIALFAFSVNAQKIAVFKFSQILDNLESYLNNGGRFMYMGGNGFYWVTSVDPERPHIIEIRRWKGTGSWEANPGEFYHSTTGELGGLWRHRGREPQKLVGVGMTGQGGDAVNSPYRRQPDSYDPKVSFIFEGVDNGLIGDFESLGLGWGAAGYEFDRLDLEKYDIGENAPKAIIAKNKNKKFVLAHGASDNDANGDITGILLNNNRDLVLENAPYIEINGL